MACGHTCRQICHMNDREHAAQKCFEPCNRFCPEGHPCVKKCYEECHPCRIPMSKILPCRHKQITECFEHPEDVFCLTKVWKVSGPLVTFNSHYLLLIFSSYLLLGDRSQFNYCTLSTDCSISIHSIYILNLMFRSYSVVVRS